MTTTSRRSRSLGAGGRVPRRPGGAPRPSDPARRRKAGTSGHLLSAVAITAVLVATAAGCGVPARGSSGQPSPEPPASPPRRVAPAAAGGGACGRLRTPPRTWRHVIWIWMENHSYDSIIGPPGSGAATHSPYVNGSLARGCGLATNYHNVTHPSLGNYLAATAGSTLGVTGDCAPQDCPQAARSLFEEVRAAGMAWRSYQESAPRPCTRVDAGLYAPRHDPAVYFRRIAADCARWDVPMGTTREGAFKRDLESGRLPAFSFVTPNLCDDAHDCDRTTGDRWLAAWVPRITDSPAYRAGSTVLFVTWDEGEGGGSNDCARNATDRSCHVATLVVSPSTPPGTRSAALFDHYGLLRTTEELLGLPRPRLGHAGDRASASMRAAFRL
jgi:phosphatidylinositol-3-phosphatase